VPSTSGRVEVNLTVRDPASSAAWYSELLGLEELYDFTGEDSRMHYIALVEPKSQFVLCLVGHQEHSGECFSEFRTGLDHLELLVDRKGDLEGRVEKLNRLQIPNSGVKQPKHTRNAMLTFRDPDNIQLEFFWRAPMP
jgi:glyoxylase I family protein